MLLSLSVRIAEEFLSKEKASMSLPDLVRMARASGYDALCMRASQVGIHSDPITVANAAALLRSERMPVTMVTANFDIVYNNDRAPDCLRQIHPHLDLASALGAPRVRVALKTDADIPFAQRAADEARERGIQLVHQCHTLSLFETVDGIVRTLTAINRPNFGLIYEPANLELCGQPYNQPTLERLAPWILNVYLQNQILRPSGKVTLDTWTQGPRTFDLLPIHSPGGIRFDSVFEGLRSIGYTGPITAHQSAVPGEPPETTAALTARYLRPALMSPTHPTSTPNP